MRKIRIQKMIAGVSIILSCFCLSDAFEWIGLPGKIGGVPCFLIIIALGLVMVYQSGSKKRAC